jgi:hypothetical protein
MVSARPQYFLLNGLPHLQSRGRQQHMQPTCAACLHVQQVGCWVGVSMGELGCTLTSVSAQGILGQPGLVAGPTAAQGAAPLLVQDTLGGGDDF